MASSLIVGGLIGKKLTYKAAGVIVGLAVGFLGEISWQASFGIYAIFIIPLITTITMLKEPELPQAAGAEKGVAEKHPLRITLPVFIFFVFTFFATLTLYPMLSGMATVLVERGMGGPAVASVCLSCYTGGGVIAGLMFGPVTKAIGRRWVMLYACVLVIIGQVVTLMTNNIIVMAIFTGIAGWGYCSIVPSVMTRIPAIADPFTIPLSTTLILAAIQGAMFFSGWWIELCNVCPLGGYAVEKSWWVCVLSYVLMAVICVFWNPDKAAEKKAS